MESRSTIPKLGAGGTVRAARRSPRPRKAFTLLELLIVIGIIGLLAAVGVPALKGIGQSNAVGAGGRQLMDDLAGARQRAINERTTVYMVFVPPQIAELRPGAPKYSSNEVKQVERLLNGQYTTYNFFTRRTLGDQPGQGQPRYLSEWRSLPEGVFLATNLFRFVDSKTWQGWPRNDLTNRPFAFDLFPFPTARNTNNVAALPYVAFNYQGQLVSPGDQYLRITKGSIIYARDANGKYTFENPEIIETPKSNAMINPFIRVDWLTGRVKSIQPQPAL